MCLKKSSGLILRMGQLMLSLLLVSSWLDVQTELSGIEDVIKQGNVYNFGLLNLKRTSC